MASKKKINLNDYELSTTLGTGKTSPLTSKRFIWQSTTDQKQKDWGILRNEDPQEG
ncbi:MAG: hypothetical protein GY696_27460 [Gammaproteobacteria bacterium]|nr:hypothetical protein [Gammaproteobacteria bacterium]